VRIPVQLGRRPEESPDVETVRFYELLLELLSDPIFQEGAWSLHDVHPAGPGDASNELLVALAWDPRYLIVVNLNGTTARGRIPLPAASFSAGGGYVFHDRYDGRRYERAGRELAGGGLSVELGAHQLHLFEISSA
jgi:hypothetical protein